MASNPSESLDPFQRGFAALATGYFDLFSKGKARKWLSYVSDALATGSAGVQLPEFDPNYRFRIHETNQKKKRESPVARLREGEHLFSYSRVPLAGAQSIRLVTIHPGGTQSSVECTLQAVQLEDKPVYEALSYTWGDPTANHAITVNGGRLLVTENLYAFLLEIRPSSVPLSFWIDGLCIDQTDIDERASQIQLMREIYASATRVCVWLGEETESTASAFELATALASTDGQNEETVIGVKDLEDSIKSRLANQTVSWRALDQIYWNPWFNRTWVIQELALAQGVQVRCGPQIIPWEDLVAAGEFLVKHHLIASLDIDPSPILALQTYRHANTHSQGMELLDLMNNSRSSQSADSRDKIYGLFGLAADIHALNVEPNYSLPVEEAFRSVALSIMHKDSNLDFLSAVEDYKWRVHTKLPSWVPDWTAHPHNTPFLSRPDLWSFDAAARSSPCIIKSSEPRVLIVRGKIIDTITRVGSADVPLRDGIPGVRETSYFRQTLTLGAVAQRQHWENIVNDIESYPTGESPLEAFQHTAIAEGALASGYSSKDLPDLYPAWKRNWRYLLNYRLTNLPKHATAHDLEDRERATVYTEAWKEAFRFRRLIVTSIGYMGLTSYSARPDDLVSVFYGGKTLYIVRPKGNGQFQFICEAYIRGLMQGQGMEQNVGVETDFQLV